jgi:hypothetical protein
LWRNCFQLVWRLPVHLADPTSQIAMCLCQDKRHDGYRRSIPAYQKALDKNFLGAWNCS